MEIVAKKLEILYNTYTEVTFDVNNTCTYVHDCIYVVCTWICKFYSTLGKLTYTKLYTQPIYTTNAAITFLIEHSTFCVYVNTYII